MEMVCIRCPRGCALTAQLRDGAPLVSGNRCPLGAEYAAGELIAPKRLFAGTVPVSGRRERLSVAVSRPVALERMMDIMAVVHQTRAAPPVTRGQVLINDVCGSGADLIATKTIHKNGWDIMQEWKDKIVLVTGSSLGIGLQIVKEFARRGARTILVARDGARMERALSAIGEGRDNVQGYLCDLGDPDSVSHLFSQLWEEYPRIDVLVNNVGAFSDKLPWNAVDDETWHKCFDLNTLCAYRCSVAVADRLIALGLGGAILNIGSSTALRLKSGRMHYTASKAALHTISQVMALDLAPHGIRVNVVSPGPTATETVQARMEDPAQQEAEAVRLRKVPLGRYAAPTDIANAVLFLVSEQASYITGAILPVDGGYTIGETV